MTRYDSIFALAKKMAKALSKNKKPVEIHESLIFDDPSKKQILENLSDESVQYNLQKLKEINVEEDWEILNTKLNRPKKSSTLTFYKVAAIIIVFISIGFLTYYTQRNLTPEAEKTIIIAGTDKAILTIEDGKEIVLERGDKLINGIIQNDGEQLTYNEGNTNTNLAHNYLTVPRGGRYKLALSDGTRIWLNAETKLKYPVAFKEGEPRTIEILYGEVYLDVSPITKHNGDIFKVITKNQEIEVIGTEFNVKAYKDEQFIYTTLVEGKVQLVLDERLVELSPSEQSTVNSKTCELNKILVDVKNEIAWVKGYFSFKEKNLQDIMLVLSRWYDIEIIFNSPSLKEVKFSGLLNKKQNIEAILDGIQNTKAINAYEIKNRTITIK